MSNIQIENLPVGAGIENSVIPAEFETKTEATVASPVVPPVTVSPQAETIVKSVEESTGVEVGADIPQRSAGFKIDPKKTGRKIGSFLITGEFKRNKIYQPKI